MHSCWAKLNQDFNQLLSFFFFFFPFVSSSPQPVPQNGHSVYVVVSFSTRELLHLDRCSMILSVSTKATNLYHNKLRHSVSFQYCTILWHFKGACTLHRDAVGEWRGECACSGRRSGAAHQSSMVLCRPELAVTVLPSPCRETQCA